jgi:hypothetical protein
MAKPTIEEIFEDVYQNNKWSGIESLSGPGSSLSTTVEIRKAIPEVIRKYDIRSVFDAPCGDFFWMKEIKGTLKTLLDSYIGGDVAATVIENIAQKYTDETFSFRQVDITKDVIPKSDLIMTRDCFHHLSYQNIIKALHNLKKSGSTYLLLSTYTDVIPNKNAKTDVYVNGRHLNFQLSPFYFPAPIESINEKTTEPSGWTDKHMCLWLLQDLKIPTLSKKELTNYIKEEDISFFSRAIRFLKRKLL